MMGPKMGPRSPFRYSFLLRDILPGKYTMVLTAPLLFRPFSNQKKYHPFP